MKCPCRLLICGCVFMLVTASNAWSQTPAYYRGYSNVHAGYAARLGVGGAAQKQKASSCNADRSQECDECARCCKCQPLLGRIGCVVQVLQCRLCGKLKRAVRQASCSLESLTNSSQGCANCPRSTCGSCSSSVQNGCGKGNACGKGNGCRKSAPAPARPPAPALEQRRLPPDPFADDPQASSRRLAPSVMLRAAHRARVFSNRTVSFRITDR